MSTLKVNTIQKRSGSAIAIGESGDTVTLTGTTNITGNTAITGTLSSTGTSFGISKYFLVHRSGDFSFNTGNWTGEFSGKLQYHSDKFYWQTGANGWQFRDSAGAAASWSISGANSSARGCQIHGHISGPTSGQDNNKKISWACETFDSANNQVHRTGGGFQTTSSDHTGIKILCGSGNMSQHSIQIYGVANTERFGGF